MFAQLGQALSSLYSVKMLHNHIIGKYKEFKLSEDQNWIENLKFLKIYEKHVVFNQNLLS